jgi:hypothetical protein
MSASKLDIWFRDEHCKPFPNLKVVEGYDWVEIRDCSNSLIKRLPVPIAEQAHVVAEVPPGCYIVQGHVCGETIPVNDYTDKVMVIVGCNQEVCVNLIVPGPKTCGMRDMHAFIREARGRISERDLEAMARGIMAATGISPEEIINEANQRVMLVKDIKEAQKVRDEYSATIDLIKSAIPMLVPKR